MGQLNINPANDNIQFSRVFNNLTLADLFKYARGEWV